MEIELENTEKQIEAKEKVNQNWRDREVKKIKSTAENRGQDINEKQEKWGNNRTEGVRGGIWFHAYLKEL